jgi:hypothetical protein
MTRHRRRLTIAAFAVAPILLLALASVDAAHDELPRPIRSELTHSFRRPDGASGYRVYAGLDGVRPDEIERALLADLRARGLDVGRVVPVSGGRRVVALERGDHVTFIVFGRRRDGRASTVIFDSSVHGTPQSPGA